MNNGKNPTLKVDASGQVQIAGAASIPPGTASVSLLVSQADTNLLTGPLSSFGAMAVNPPLGKFVIDRSKVQKVLRNGKTATNATLKSKTQFAGESSRRFLG